MLTFIHTSNNADLRLVKGDHGVAGHAVLFFVGGMSAEDVDGDKEYADEENLRGAYSTGCFGLPHKNGLAVYALELDDAHCPTILANMIELDDRAFSEMIRAFGSEFEEQFGRPMTRGEAEAIFEDRDEFIWTEEGDRFEHYEIEDACWMVQGAQARAARRQGFLLVEGTDEQGTVYFADFTGRLEVFNDNVRRLA